MKKPQHQSDIRLLHMRCSVSLPGSSIFVFFSLSVDAKDLGVFDPVNILWLRSAGWHRLPDASHWDAGQGSAGVHRQRGGRPIKRWHNSLLGTRAGSSKGSYISRSVCQRRGGVESWERRWANRRQTHYSHSVIIEGRPTFPWERKRTCAQTDLFTPVLFRLMRCNRGTFPKFLWSEPRV